MWCGAEESNLLRSLLAKFNLLDTLISRLGWNFLSPETPQERNSAPNHCHAIRKNSDRIVHKHLHECCKGPKQESEDFQPKRNRHVNVNVNLDLQEGWVTIHPNSVLKLC